MPKSDSCQPQVIRALRKAGWQTDDRPLYIRKWGKHYLDLMAVKGDQVLYIEVKCFPVNVQRGIYEAVGQYLAYQTLLQSLHDQTRLVLAIPANIYRRLPLLRAAVERYQIEGMLVDLEREEIVQWITWP